MYDVAPPCIILLCNVTTSCHFERLSLNIPTTTDKPLAQTHKIDKIARAMRATLHNGHGRQEEKVAQQDFLVYT